MEYDLGKSHDIFLRLIYTMFHLLQEIVVRWGQSGLVAGLGALECLLSRDMPLQLGALLIVLELDA